MTEIILHVGFHKTGTSSIQETLYNKDNSEILKADGILYPHSKFANHSITIYSAFFTKPEDFHIHKRSKFTKEEITDFNSLHLKLFQEEITEKKYKKIIISGEDISILSKQELKKFKCFLEKNIKDIKFKIVIFLRHPLDFYISMKQEMVKNGYKEELAAQLLKEDSYQKRLETLSSVFGEDTLQVYKFEEARNHHLGLVYYFLEKIGVNKQTIPKIKPIKMNMALSDFGYKVIKYISDIANPLEDPKNIRENQDIYPLFNLSGNKFDISFKEKSRILKTTHEDYTYIKKKYGFSYSKMKIFEFKFKKRSFSNKQLYELKDAFLNLNSYIRQCILGYLFINKKKYYQEFLFINNVLDYYNNEGKSK